MSVRTSEPHFNNQNRGAFILTRLLQGTQHPPGTPARVTRIPHAVPRDHVWRGKASIYLSFRGLQG